MPRMRLSLRTENTLFLFHPVCNPFVAFQLHRSKALRPDLRVLCLQWGGLSFEKRLKSIFCGEVGSSIEEKVHSLFWKTFWRHITAPTAKNSFFSSGLHPFYVSKILHSVLPMLDLPINGNLNSVNLHFFVFDVLYFYLCLTQVISEA